MKTGVVILGLKDFRSALRAAADATPTELSRALKAGGRPLLEAAKKLAPKKSGHLASTAKIRTRATSAMLVFTAPYAKGAEYGLTGKWKGFARYGPRGNRFANRALDEAGDEVADVIAREMELIVTAHGWFR